MKRFLFLCLAVLAAGPAIAQTAYKLPPSEIVKVLDAPPAPEALVSPTGEAMLLVEYEPYPSIALLSEPILRLGGIRISPRIGGRQRTRRYTAISLQAFDGASPRRIQLPEHARISLPLWSHDGQRFAFTRDLEEGIELWVGDAASGRASAVSSVRLNDVLSRPFAWTPDNRLLVHAVAADRGAPPAFSHVPTGPTVQETAGKVSQMATFEDLLKTANDEDLFEYYATSRLMLVAPATVPTGKRPSSTRRFLHSPSRIGFESRFC